MISFNPNKTLHIIEEFEGVVADLFGTKHAVAVSSGTMADTIALAVLKNLNPEKKKVAVPALTFIAQVNSIIYNGLEPAFYDVSPNEIPEEGLLCDFPVDLLGRMAHLERRGVPMIEDACEAMGSKFNGKYAGTYGDMGTFSFYDSHSVGLGEGGMIVTDNKEYADLARVLRNHGSRGGEVTEVFKFDVIGFNGKMAGAIAARGIRSMTDENLKNSFEYKRQIFLKLGGRERLGEYVVPHGVLLLSDERDAKMKELYEAGIESRRMFSCIPVEEKAYQYLGYRKGDFPVSEELSRRGFYVPCHQNLISDEVEYIKSKI